MKDSIFEREEKGENELWLNKKSNKNTALEESMTSLHRYLP